MATSDSEFNSDLLLAHKLPETRYTYNERDVAIYALGIGACGQDAVDSDELKFVYHRNGQDLIQVLPTFASLFTLGSLTEGLDLPGFKYDPSLLLHGQQYIEIYRPLPSKASVSSFYYVCKAAILELETRCYEEGSGELLCMNRTTVFLRGAGGFSNSSQPFSYKNYPSNQGLAVKIPQRQPLTALLYRLSGDYNPLHSDPEFAKLAGFPRPILHGLCTLGFAIKAIIKCVCKGDPTAVKTISGRFLTTVFPGETLITEMWLEGLRVIYQTKVKERNKTVLAGYVDIRGLSSSL
ncbi:Enoyl-CoA hydratase 2, peroxisomal [Arabidopsis thaliana]